MIAEAKIKKKDKKNRQNNIEFYILLDFPLELKMK